MTLPSYSGSFLVQAYPCLRPPPRPQVLVPPYLWFSAIALSLYFLAQFPMGSNSLIIYIYANTFFLDDRQKKIISKIKLLKRHG